MMMKKNAIQILLNKNIGSLFSWTFFLLVENKYFQCNKVFMSIQNSIFGAREKIAAILAVCARVNFDFAGSLFEKTNICDCLLVCIVVQVQYKIIIIYTYGIGCWWCMVKVSELLDPVCVSFNFFFWPQEKKENNFKNIQK